MPFKDPEERRAYHRQNMRDRRRRQPVKNPMGKFVMAMIRSVFRDEQPVKYYCIKEAAAQIGINEKTLRRWITAGKVESHRTGKYKGGWPLPYGPYEISDSEVKRLKDIKAGLTESN